MAVSAAQRMTVDIQLPPGKAKHALLLFQLRDIAPQRLLLTRRDKASRGSKRPSSDNRRRPSPAPQGDRRLPRRALTMTIGTSEARRAARRMMAQPVLVPAD